MKPHTKASTTNSSNNETINNYGAYTHGLDDAEVINSRKEYGINQLNYKKENGFIDATEPIYGRVSICL
jgi:hypothetical protein